MTFRPAPARASSSGTVKPEPPAIRAPPAKLWVVDWRNVLEIRDRVPLSFEESIVRLREANVAVFICSYVGLRGSRSEERRAAVKEGIAALNRRLVRDYPDRWSEACRLEYEIVDAHREKAELVIALGAVGFVDDNWDKLKRLPRSKQAYWVTDNIPFPGRDCFEDFNEAAARVIQEQKFAASR